MAPRNAKRSLVDEFRQSTHDRDCDPESIANGVF
jgi:hypothetical protein